MSVSRRHSASESVAAAGRRLACARHRDVGGLIDLVRFDMLKESALDGFAVGCWIYGGLLGGVVTGMAFFAYRCSHVTRTDRSASETDFWPTEHDDS